MEFIERLKNIADTEFNVSYTENGARGYQTTGKALLDATFAVSSFRDESDESVVRQYAKAFFEDKLLAIKWLFYVGDVRGGLGERRLFRLGLLFLSQVEPELTKKLLPLVAEYTRWDNLLVLLDTHLQGDVCALYQAQIKSDMENMEKGQPVSLCAKWLPSINASSLETVRYAKIIVTAFGVSQKGYRVMLSRLRSYIDIVEKKMSEKAWGEIDYETVPSRANLVYNQAFLRNDKARRESYLSSLERGESKINAGTLFPHDIVHQYCQQVGYYETKLKKKDVALEELWKALPDYVKGGGNTLCVSDGSGSMYACAGNTNVTCLEIANALTIYFAERCAGDFKDKYITFSETPQLVDFSHCKTLRDKIGVALSNDEVANTNIEAVFQLILRTAVKGKMKQSDLPRNILILSDMEFDEGVECNRNHSMDDKTLFEAIAKKYERFGYQLPRLVFWNICSRTKTVPVKENPLGVTLVSGFSPTVLQMVLSGELDPFTCLVTQLNDSRYDSVEQAVAGLA